MLKASHKAPQSEFVVNSIAGPRSRSQNTEELPSGYESDNVTIRDGPQKVEEESSTSTVDNNDSNDSFEAEIDRILPERKDYIRSVDQSTTGASCLESEAQWDIDHEKDIVPISVAAAGQPVANDDTDPFSSGQLTSGAEQCTAVESTVVKNEKDPWMEQKLKEIFGAIEIQYSAEETSRYIVTPPSEVTPIQQTDFVRSRQDETPTKKGNIHSESSMLGETSGDIPRHSSPRKSQDTPSVATPVQDEEDYNKAAPVKLTVGGDAAEHLEAIGKMESISASSSVSHCNPIMPWVENALPEKFELIRELVFSRVPKDVVRLDGVFKQLTTGLVEKVLLNRKARVLRIIYVEPIAAREQYIKFYNRGLYIPKGSAPPQSSASSASSAASGKKALEQYHVLMPDLFQYSVNSKPLSSQLRDAIYKGNLTRVCRMRGAVQGLSVKKLEEDLFKLVPNLPKNVHDVFDSIHINEEAGEILVRFTAMVYSARTFNFLKTSKGYYGFIPGYGPDPCNYKPLAEIRQKHEQTPKSTAMVQHKEPNKEEPSQKIPEDNKPIQPAPVKIHIEAYKNPAARGADNMDPAQINYMLRQFAERGLISNRVLRARGLLPPAGAKWDKGDDTDVKREDGNWAALEQNAVRAYRASLKEKNDISARAGPTIPDPDTVYAREDYSTRLVCVTGLPSYISYDLFCPYVKGGAVDTVRLNPDEGTAVIIFLRAKDATNYRDYIIANEIYIDNHRMINQNPSLTRLHNMRLWDPVKVLREGLSRCVFVEGIPNGTTPSILKADIASMNPTVRIEYESIVINGVCARVCCPSISMANFIHRNLGSQPKYTGVRVRYEEDFCSGHLSFIGQAFTP
jgi:hypothetical protein